MELPKGVHVVVSRGRQYFYWHPGRGTKAAGLRVRLPDDPMLPEFWSKLRELQGVGVTVEATVNAVIDDYEASKHFQTQITEGTRDQYRRALRLARQAWGTLPIAGLRPVYVRELMDELAETPGKANNLLSAMRAFSKWALSRDKITQMLTTGLTPYDKDGGHKPWTDGQIAAAHEHLTGVIRRGIMLGLYTGQRGSDLVRLGWTDVDDNGFHLVQRKTGREVWCPILPELAAEMATWERRPGPFLLQESGRPFTRKLFSVHFREVRDATPALAGTTIHGLRATAVVRLRREGLSTSQIEDIIGMSPAMISRYCRFADKKANGQAAVVFMRERRTNRDL